MTMEMVQPLRIKNSFTFESIYIQQNIMLDIFMNSFHLLSLTYNLFDTYATKRNEEKSLCKWFVAAGTWERRLEQSMPKIPF